SEKDIIIIMLVFIDESGDTGFKFGSGSSDYLTITLLIFKDHEVAQLADERISALRCEWRYDEKFEFHFNKLDHKRRIDFLKTLTKYDFCHYNFVMNKQKLLSNNLKKKDQLYNYTCRVLFENAGDTLNDAIVVMDKHGSQDSKHQFDSYIKTCMKQGILKEKAIRKIKMQDSKNNNLLQLADMICGAVARKFSGKKDADTYYKLIKHREIRTQCWPKENLNPIPFGTHTIR
ncbi:MAG: DUF3800 domain-containing protein, partial [Pyrinomonadaceae bacterium]